MILLNAIIEADYKKRVTLFAGEQVNKDSIVLLGDSIIDYWPYKDYYQNDNIVNRGIAGDTSLGILNRLDQIISLNPKAVIIHVGGNDLVRLKEDNDTDSIVKRILKIKYELETNSNTKVYIVSLTPVLRGHNITNNTYMQKRTNQMIDAINDELSLFTKIIDVNSYLKDDKGNLKLEYTKDGLHLTKHGYDVFSYVIGKKVKELVFIKQ